MASISKIRGPSLLQLHAVAPRCSLLHPHAVGCVELLLDWLVDTCPTSPDPPLSVEFFGAGLSSTTTLLLLLLYAYLQVCSKLDFRLSAVRICYLVPPL